MSWFCNGDTARTERILYEELQPGGHAFNASSPIGMPVHSDRVYAKVKTKCLATDDGEKGSVSGASADARKDEIEVGLRANIEP